MVVYSSSFVVSAATVSDYVTWQGRRNMSRREVIVLYLGIPFTCNFLLYQRPLLQIGTKFAWKNSDCCDAPITWYSIEGGMCDVRESSCALLHRRSFPEGLGMHRRRRGLGGLHLPLSWKLEHSASVVRIRECWYGHVCVAGNRDGSNCIQLSF